MKYLWIFLLLFFFVGCPAKRPIEPPQLKSIQGVIKEVTVMPFEHRYDKHVLIEFEDGRVIALDINYGDTWAFHKGHMNIIEHSRYGDIQNVTVEK